tara:strand:- start:460 stop:738 length:279 start_codon:yes stop_codon:yes gene_type:complete
MAEEKTSKITKTITRLIPTAPYANLTVSVSSEEEITWTTVEERIEKTKKHAALLCKEALVTIEKAMKELDCGQKNASTNQSKSKNSDFDSLE